MIKPDKERKSSPRARKFFKKFTIAFLGLFFLFLPVAFLMYVSLLVGLYHKDFRAWVKRRFEKKEKFAIRSTGENKVVMARVGRKGLKKTSDVLPDMDTEYWLGCGHPVTSHGGRTEDCP